MQQLLRETIERVVTKLNRELYFHMKSLYGDDYEKYIIKQSQTATSIEQSVQHVKGTNDDLISQLLPVVIQRVVTKINRELYFQMKSLYGDDYERYIIKSTISKLVEKQTSSQIKQTFIDFAKNNCNKKPTREELKQRIGRVSGTNIKSLVGKISQADRYSSLKRDIIEATSYLPEDCKFTERLYQILNDLDSRPLCKGCQINYTKFDRFTKGYRPFCSKKCPSLYIQRRDESITEYLSREQISEQLKLIPAENLTILVSNIVQVAQYKLLKESIIEVTNYLPEDCKFIERIYQIIYSLDSRPLCKNCQNNYVGFKNFKFGYYSFCSNRCFKTYAKERDESITEYLSREEIVEYLKYFSMDNIKTFIIKITQTQKYKVVKESIIKVTSYLSTDCTFSERLYHIVNNLTSRPVCKICKQNYVNFKDFYRGYHSHCSTGNCGQNDPEVKEKAKQTWQQNWGEDHPMKVKSFREKIEQTNLERWGSKCPFSSPIIREKIQQTWQDKWGADNPMKAKEVHEKAKQTCQKHWGEDYPMKCSIPREKASQTNLKNNYKYMSSPERLGEDYELVTPLEEYKSIKYNKLKFKHKKCGHIFDYSIANGKEPLCPKCYANFSRFEESVRNFCEQHFENITYNSRQIIPPLEIDIFIPQLNIAIECNGVYWHREEVKGKDYHLQKYVECAKRNIRLIQIFEDEWKHKQKLIESILLNAFGKSETIVDATQCQIYKIPQDLADKFLNHCHLEGSFTGTHYGLIFDNNLVSIISTAPISNNSKYNLGIYRFCDMRNTKVIGGLETLIDHIKRNHTNHNLAAYVDLRYSIGEELSNVGFKYSHLIEPTFSYVKSNQRYPPPHSIEEAQSLLESYDLTKSIEENLNDNNFFKIYDSGYAIFELINNT